MFVKISVSDIIAIFRKSDHMIIIVLDQNGELMQVDPGLFSTWLKTA